MRNGLNDRNLFVRDSINQRVFVRRVTPCTNVLKHIDARLNGHFDGLGIIKMSMNLDAPRVGRSHNGVIILLRQTFPGLNDVRAPINEL